MSTFSERYLPTFTQGQSANCSSLIVTHVWNEAGILVKPWIKTAADFTEFLKSAFPGDKMQKIRDSIEARYPAKGAPFYGKQQARVRQVLQDSTFTCNSRQLYDAYKGKTYVMQYNVPTATHGSDLLASCYHRGLDVVPLAKSYIDDLAEATLQLLQAIISYFATTYQRYFAAHALSGDPNTLNEPNARKWQLASDDGDEIDNALKAGLIVHGRTPFFEVGYDRENSAETCNFWNGIAQEIGNLYTGENSSGDESGVFDKFFGVQVQEPEKGIPVIPEL